jgi:anti-sigma B factor antagonist
MTPTDTDHPRLQATVSESGGRTVVAIGGELDLATADPFQQLLRTHLAGGPVLLDLSKLSFMDSSGVWAIDAVLREVEREGWTLAVHPEMQRNVQRVLELTRMWDVLPFDAGEGP